MTPNLKIIFDKIPLKIGNTHLSVVVGCLNFSYCKLFKKKIMYGGWFCGVCMCLCILNCWMPVFELMQCFCPHLFLARTSDQNCSIYYKEELYLFNFLILLHPPLSRFIRFDRVLDFSVSAFLWLQFSLINNSLAISSKRLRPNKHVIWEFY